MNAHGWRSWLAIFFGCAAITSARAQFSSVLLQNENYWADGKAEFNIYAAEMMRDGVSRSGEILHIYARDKIEGAPVLRLNQILNLPTGLTVWQEMHSSFWRVDSALLQRFCLTSSDSVSNVFKEAHRVEAEFAYEYRGASAAGERVALPAGSYFYEELPWLVRTIDFSKPGEFEIHLAASVRHANKDNFNFAPAKISYQSGARLIEVTVQQASGADHFSLDRDGPHLLREWKMADGSHLKLKRNLKVDFWNYTKPGDRERALNNPMLRLPD